MLNSDPNPDSHYEPLIRQPDAPQLEHFSADGPLFSEQEFFPQVEEYRDYDRDGLLPSKATILCRPNDYFEPTPEIKDLLSRPVITIGWLNRFRIEYQKHDRGCVSATLSMVLNQISSVAPDYDEIYRELNSPRFNHLNWKNLIHKDTVLTYVNQELAPQRRNYHLLEHRIAKHGVADLVNALRETREPVMLPYMPRLFSDSFVSKFNAFLEWAGSERLARWITKGDAALFTHYPHLGAVVGVCKSRTGEDVVLIADPWKGAKLLGVEVSPRSPGIQAITAIELEKLWTKFEKPKIDRIATEYWYDQYKTALLRLVPEGSYFVIKPESE